MRASRTLYDDNRRTALSLLVVFLGIFVAFVVASLWFGSERVDRRYAFLVEIAVRKKHSIVSQSFGPFLPLLRHNLLVVGTAVLLGLVYRSFGVLIVLVWNAASWGLVLPWLVLRALETGVHRPFALIAGCFVAVLPHLVLEALSYVTAGVAAVFLSFLLTIDDIAESWTRVLKSCGRMFALALVSLVTAAALESYWTPLVLGAFRSL